MAAEPIPNVGTYRVVLAWDADWRGWVVTVPRLPGCVTQGKSEAQALERAHEAIRGHLAALADIGAPIPEPDVPGVAVAVVQGR